MSFKRKDTREFIVAQSIELAKLARSVDMPNVAYMLEVASVEANNQITAKPRSKKAA